LSPISHVTWKFSVKFGAAMVNRASLESYGVSSTIAPSGMTSPSVSWDVVVMPFERYSILMLSITDRFAAEHMMRSWVECAVALIRSYLAPIGSTCFVIKRQRACQQESIDKGDWH
jgi:hypothetical protein